MQPRPRGARAGNSLYMVLLITGVLFILSMMLPQVLVQAAGGIKLDHGRDQLMDAMDSGIAFAEARLKHDLANTVGAWGPAERGGATPPPQGLTPDENGPGIPGMAGWVATPSYDNPDFGPKHRFTFEVRCLKARLFNVKEYQNGQALYQFNYALHAGAWEVARGPGTSKKMEVTGVVSVIATISPQGTRTVDSVKLQGIDHAVEGEYAPIKPIPLRKVPPPAS